MIKCRLSISNFRTPNIINNMGVANFVNTIDEDYHIGFNTEYYDRYSNRYLPTKIIYVINRDLVLKHREKMTSNKI